MTKRLYSALSVTYRYDVELFEPEEIRQREWNRLRAWVTANNIHAWMNGREQAVVEAEPGTFDDAQTLMASWAIECANVCAWALNSYPRLRYDEPIDGIADLGRATMFLNDIPTDMALRGEGELVEYQKMVRTCLWRLREYDRGHVQCDLRRIIAQMKAVDLSAAHIEFVGDDLCVHGGVIDALEKYDLDSLYCSVQERFKTINWILDEDGADYHETDVDT